MGLAELVVLVFILWALGAIVVHWVRRRIKRSDARDMNE